MITDARQFVSTDSLARISEKRKTRVTRREMLKTFLTATGVALIGFEDLRMPALAQDAQRDVFRQGQFLELVEFVGEGILPMETPMGAGLDGRLYTDLSGVTPEHPTTPTEKFFLRTRASEFLDDHRPWAIKLTGPLTGPLKRPMEIGMPALRKMSKPAGLHLMECSGNVRLAHFGMLSVAEWAGVPVREILESARIDNGASRVLISGFDRYPVASSTSLPGASWIFTVDELQASKAFFATKMNGASLTKDHGAPVRLVVPNWYGCTCIKWVNEVTLVDDDAAVTSQMEEFAGRTMQQGVPKLAKDYRPAVIEQAAMPVRVEKWRVEGKIKYRVLGIAWGGSRPIGGLEIRFNKAEDFVSVDDFKQTVNDPWSFWTHPWTPKEPSIYDIQLRVKDNFVPARRLNSGHYVRSVRITANSA
jgi:DMSO/TMAO reductase YedYZ molybdopterin-dependent catalytic subunit